jgi:hypothetical protein
MYENRSAPLKTIPLPPFRTIAHPLEPLKLPLVIGESAWALEIGGKKRESKATGIKINALVKRVNLYMRPPARQFYHRVKGVLPEFLRACGMKEFCFKRHKTPAFNTLFSDCKIRTLLAKVITSIDFWNTCVLNVSSKKI